MYKILKLNNIIKYIIFAGIMEGFLKTSKIKLSNQKKFIFIFVVISIIMGLDCFSSYFSNTEMELENHLDNAKKLVNNLNNIDLNDEQTVKLAQNKMKKLKKAYDKTKKKLIKENTFDELPDEPIVDTPEEPVVNTQEEPVVNTPEEPVVETTPEDDTVESPEDMSHSSQEYVLDTTDNQTCSRQVQKVKNKYKSKIKEMKAKSKDSRYTSKYKKMLIKSLLNEGIIDDNDVKNINRKLESGLLNEDDIIDSLEKLRNGEKLNKADINDSENELNEMKYSNKPPSYYKTLGEQVPKTWTDDYVILNTDKWAPKYYRAPVCSTSNPTEVVGMEGYPSFLKNWNASSKISNTSISKKWAKSLNN